MTDTAYEMISTTKLTSKTVVYLSRPEIVVGIVRMRKITIVQTNKNTYRIPAGEVGRKMWKVLL